MILPPQSYELEITASDIESRVRVYAQCDLMPRPVGCASGDSAERVEACRKKCHGLIDRGAARRFTYCRARPSHFPILFFKLQELIDAYASSISTDR